MKSEVSGNYLNIEEELGEGRGGGGGGAGKHDAVPIPTV